MSTETTTYKDLVLTLKKVFFEGKNMWELKETWKGHTFYGRTLYPTRESAEFGIKYAKESVDEQYQYPGGRMNRFDAALRLAQ